MFKVSVLNFLVAVLFFLGLRALFGFSDENSIFYAGILLLLFGLFPLAFIALTSLWMRLSVVFIHSIIVFVAVSIAVIHAANINNYGPLVADTMRAIFQTNILEAAAYMDIFVSDLVVGYIIVSVLLSIISLLVFYLKVSSGNARYLVFLLSAIVGIAAVQSGNSDLELLVSEANAYRKTVSEFHDSRVKHSSFGGEENNGARQGNIVIVIGESTNRQHLGVYRYFRNTTPYLSSLKNQLVAYEDIISTHSHTNESLADALTFNDRSSRKSITQVQDLINYAKEKGYFTAWLSNQNEVGVWENIVTALANEADITRFHDPSGGKKFTRSIYDEVMLDTLDGLLKKEQSRDRKLIFLHMMATHFPYCNIVPPEFNFPAGSVFNHAIDETYFGNVLASSRSKKDFVDLYSKYIVYLNCYDGAIRYVDHMLKRLFDRFSQSDEPSLVIYLSDHGEAPELMSGHESRMHSHLHVEVPFLIWANDAYRAEYPEVMKQIDDNKSHSGSLIDFSYSVASLITRENTDDFSKRSFFSDDYEVFDRDTLHNSVGYDFSNEKSDYFERTRGNLNLISESLGEKMQRKLWAHRINSFGSLYDARNIFNGIELDVVFHQEDRKFYVYHPPAENLKLSLEQYLQQVDSKLGLWLDWKNLTDKNMASAVERLEKLESLYKIRSRSIVETSSQSTRVEALNHNGWHSSYYLPTNELLRSVAGGSAQDMQKWSDKIRSIVKNGKYRAISFDYRLLGFFREYLSDFTSDNDLKVYAWNQQLRIDKDIDLDVIDGLAKDVDVLLVNFPSPFDR